MSYMVERMRQKRAAAAHAARAFGITAPALSKRAAMATAFDPWLVAQEARRRSPAAPAFRPSYFFSDRLARHEAAAPALPPSYLGGGLAPQRAGIAPDLRPRFGVVPVPRPPVRPAVFAAGTHIRAASNFFGVYGHDGIALGPESGNQVAHLSALESKNSRDAHVRITSMETFANGRKVVAVAYKEPTFPDVEVLQRVMTCLGQGGWNLLDFNCEHWCRLIKTGKAKSEQVIDWAKLAGLLGALWMLGI